MVTIVKRGNVESVFQGTCGTCGTEIEATKHELGAYEFEGGDNWLSNAYICPVCDEYGNRSIIYCVPKQSSPPKPLWYPDDGDWIEVGDNVMLYTDIPGLLSNQNVEYLTLDERKNKKYKKIVKVPPCVDFDFPPESSRRIVAIKKVYYDN